MSRTNEPSSQVLAQVNIAKQNLLSQLKSLKQLATTGSSGNNATASAANTNQEIANVIHNLQTTLDGLFLVPMSLPLLKATKIGIRVTTVSNKMPPRESLASHGDAIDKIKTDSKLLLLQWKIITGCQDLARKALAEFRKLEQQHAEAKRSKPDMIAYKELRWEPQYQSLAGRVHGELEGVPIGLKLRGRGEAAILGIHRSILSGIDAEKDHPCFAVCLGGKYDDDDAEGDDGAIVYTGAGGLNKRGDKIITDQVENPANQSLILSYSTGDPIRVLRKLGGRASGREYQYDGLYTCADYTYESSSDGPKVYKFTLRPIPNKSTFQIRKKIRSLRGR